MSALIAAITHPATFVLGVREGLDPEISSGMTFDDDPESPRSVAYDTGLNVADRLTGTKH